MRRRDSFGAALVLALVALAACGGSRAQRADVHARAGAALLRRGEIERGCAELEAALALDPARVDTRMTLARAYAGARRSKRAAEQFRRIVARDRRSVDAWVGWGDALAAQGRIAQAVRRWHTAVRLAPRTDVLERLGIGLARTGAAHKADGMFRRLKSPSPAALAAWGVALDDLGRRADADRRFREALAADPGEPTALRRLGERLSVDETTRAEGVALLERLTIADPGNAAGLEALARAYVASGRSADAETLVRRALSATDDDTPAAARRQALLQDVAARIPRAAASPDAPDVVLVLVDTLRADHVTSYGYARATTPELDRLAAGGVLFENAFAQAPWTAASAGTILTGLYPSVHGIDRGVRWGEGETGRLPFLLQRTLVPSERTLAEVLREHGWRTAAFVSNVYMSAVFGFAQGFDTYDDGAADYAGDVMTAKRRAERTNARVFAWLDALPPEPFFLLVHYNDPHWPYDPPAPFGRAWVDGYRGSLTPRDTSFLVESEGRPVQDLRPEDVDYLIGLYDGEIAYADASLGRLLERVRIAARTRPLCTVVASDHGEEFLDHGSASHGYTLYDEQLHVPLIVHAPDRLAPRRVHAQVRLVDVAPTVLDLAGVDATGVAMQGESLRPLLDGGETRGRTAFAEAPLRGEMRALRTADGVKLIDDADRRRTLVFDVTRDPHERQPFAGRRPELETDLQRWTEENRSRSKAVPAGGTLVDDPTRRRLEALGYVR